MTLTKDKIIKSQSVSHVGYSSSTAEMTVGRVFYNPKSNLGYKTSFTSDKQVHFGMFKNFEIASAISSIQDKVNNTEFEKPNIETMDLLKDIIKKITLKNIQLDFVNPSHDGGLIVEFHNKGTYHLIELFNDGDIVLLKRNVQSKKREVFDLDIESLDEFITQLSL